MTDSNLILADALLKLTTVLERIEQKLDSASAETGEKRDAAKILGISIKTLERRLPELTENVHYWQEGGKTIFDLNLMRDWQRNRNNPIAHQKAIELRRQQLLSQQKRGRK